VKCRICNAIAGREKLLISKLDSLIKHLGQRKAQAQGENKGMLFESH